ncbi:hypothetical protein GCM10015535_44230 [Streptomyces gelaticus]|uniref:Uncharacterized protein n=1 Tax=Streptomyces gelaticus TaxID=285446 RepID=A0ABQ2W5K5_9ACTN|nr:hypothetical protein GCM10015535_44230 [Streptomyces gelaticus]
MGAADVFGTSPRRCGKRRVVGTAVPVERVAQGVDGLALEAKPDVGVGAGSDADIRYAVTRPCAEGTGMPRLLAAIFLVSLARAYLRVVP